MAKAQFSKHQKVWVDAVGCWAAVEKITPVWAKGFDEPVRIIARKTKAAGKLLGAFTWAASRAQFFADLGYQFIALGTDQAYFQAGIQKMLSDRGEEKPVT